MLPVHRLTRLAPFGISLTGRTRDRALAAFERAFPLRGILDIGDGITIDGSNRNEAMLFYFFHNVLRHYRRSPLYRYMRSRLSRDSLFLDIGANLGIYGYLAKKEIGCSVFAFEPEPRHLAFLTRNAHLFDRVLGVALSNQAGMGDFYVGDDDHPTASSLVMSNRGYEQSDYAGIVRVGCRRLDEIIVDDDTIRMIRLAKIDVEGGEEAVVEGMESILEKNRFDIWCEVRGEQSDRNPGSYAKVCRRLDALGYQPYVYEEGRPRRFVPDDIRRVFDLLFLPA